MKKSYDINKAVEQKTALMEEISDEAVQEAKEIEEANYKKAKKARKELEKAEQKQKMTTEEIRKQNEKLAHGKKSAIGTLKGAEKAKAQAIALEEEKNAFDILAPAKSKVKRWNAKDTKGLGEAENMESRDKKEMTSKSAEKEEKLGDLGGELSEEAKANEELGKIFKSVKRINKETDVQKGENKKEETNLQDIMKVSKRAKKSTKEADEKLQKNL